VEFILYRFRISQLKEGVLQMRKYKEFEIYLLTTGELLVDKLTFNQVPELFGAYEDLYGENTVTVICREFKHPLTINTRSKSKEYKNAWIEYFGELQLIGNLT
jgi:hypothetical protein